MTAIVIELGLGQVTTCGLTVIGNPSIQPNHSCKYTC